MSTQNSSTQQLRAIYTDPTTTNSDPKNFTLELKSLPAETDTDGKTAYLSSLRSRLGGLQKHVNSFLTEQMEKDKVLQQQQESKSGSPSVKFSKATAVKSQRDEELEEEMYGEEEEDE